MSFEITKYDARQLEIYRRGEFSDNEADKPYREVDDLDPSTHTAEQMEAIQHIRSNTDKFNALWSMDLSEFSVEQIYKLAKLKDTKESELDEAYTAVQDAARTLIEARAMYRELLKRMKQSRSLEKENPNKKTTVETINKQLAKRRKQKESDDNER